MSVGNQRGFTLVELMVSMLLFAVVAVGMVAFTTSTLQTLSTESRVSLGAMELKNALGLMTSELRMSSAISPYLPGDNIALTNCSAAVTATATSVKFLISEDDSSAVGTAGIQPYYVGYRYDAASKQLLRGKIPIAALHSCTLPAGDPTLSPIADTVATRVVQIDVDQDGTEDPVFSLNNNILTINLGIQVQSPGGDFVTQQFVSKAYMRVHS